MARQLIASLLNSGVDENADPAAQMRVRLSNELAFGDLVTALVVAPLWAWLSGDWWWAPVLILAFVPLVAPLWLNRRGSFRAARVLAIVWSSILLPFVAYTAGEGCHVEIGLAVTVCGTLILLPPEEPHHRLLSAAPFAGAIALFVVRWLVPTQGLVPAAYQSAVFVLVFLIAVANIAARTRVLLAEAKRRAVLLERSSDAKSRFLAHMSHELRTPLAGVIGLTDLALDGEVPARERELLTHSKRNAQHLLGLLNGVLDFAKLEAGAMDFEEVPFDVRRCADEAIDLVRPRANEKGIAVQVELELPDEVWRLGDALRIRQVLVNLLDNAIKFTEAGHVRLEAVALGDDRVRFVVEDTGVGIAPEALDHLFEPFLQADAGIARRYGGTGLGLTIAKELVEGSGGTIQGESTVGVGTRFAVELPLPKTEAPEVEPDASSSTPTPGMSVLVAEDDLTNQLVVRLMLERLGAATTIVSNGAEVLEACDARHWDLVLMDMRMPEMDGLTATRELRARDYAGPICGLTANAMKSDQERCLEAGMNEVATKPVSVPQLAKLLVRYGEAR